MSRETARRQNNLPVLMAAEPWDLVVLDEAHAARRASQEETEFNRGNLLLELLRGLQLQRKARGFMLLSATPMQTQPWEPWDLLSVLGEGNSWLADFGNVRSFYDAIAALERGQCAIITAQRAAQVIADDSTFPTPPGEPAESNNAANVARRLAFATSAQRTELAEWLRRGSPLNRRMHRNTRQTLRKYVEMGLLDHPPPRRSVQDFQYDYDDERERAVYDRITSYINRRFDELEGEKRGKGFVMTVYRRRAASSPFALRRSLERRGRGLLQVIQRRAHDELLERIDAPEALDSEDLPEDLGNEKPSTALPSDPALAQQELTEVNDLLQDLRALDPKDSKLTLFFALLKKVTDDGRSALVFTEYAETMEYLRDVLVDYYGRRLGCYSGNGGQVWTGEHWKSVTKDSITRMLRDDELSLLVCTDAASEGLNLQAAGAVLNYDLPWTPSKVEQRIGRIDRIGQRHKFIYVVNLFLKDSVDERVYSVLHSRCNLFEHFVGAMQPVLAQARRILLGQEPEDLDDLEARAAEVERDPLTSEIYLQSEASDARQPNSIVARADFAAALKRLTPELGFRVRSASDKDRIELSSPELKKTVYATSVEALEAHSDLRPLSPFDERLRLLSESLWLAGERLPLVVGSYERGPFRATVALWIAGDDVDEVKEWGHLNQLIDKWDGQYPDAALWSRSIARARRRATRVVNKAASEARRREAEGIGRQLAAARLRLTRELGRYLVCAGSTPDELNATLYEEMRRGTGGSRRLQRCHNRLGGEYPEWPEALRGELADFSSKLTANQRQARLMGSELDAALQDPRWRCK